MPRFSARAKEIHDEIRYYKNITNAKKILENLNDPLDITFGKLFIAFQYLMFQQLEKFLEILAGIENENIRLKDQYIQFMVNLYYCIYYMGINGPIRSKELAEKYLINISQSYQTLDYQDDWEKFYCFGWYYYTKSLFEVIISDNLFDAITFQKKCIEAWSKIPDDGEEYSARGHNNLALLYLESGNLEEAENSYSRVLESNKKWKGMFPIWTLGNLSWLAYIKGDLQKAKELNLILLEAAKQNNIIIGIYNCLTTYGSYLIQEGNYDEAIEAYQESLVYRKQHGDQLQIYWGYFSIFEFYYKKFKLTKDNSLFKQLELTLTDLRELVKTNLDNKTVVNYTNYAHSLILKHGNIRKKGRAMDILEELVEFYPRDLKITLNLLELLFEDYIQSEDLETINQINELMVRINKIPLRNNPRAIFSFISKFIFLAKYTYYIKGDPGAAIEILFDAKDHLNEYKLNNLVEVLDSEIQALKNDITKWDDLDISIKERIKISEFSNYLQEALNMVNKKDVTGSEFESP